MELIIIRTTKNKEITKGTLLVMENDITLFKCETIELPDKGNQKNISCIPEGRYIIRKRRSPKFGEHYIVEKVPTRSMILIHVGNDIKDTEGCILVGSRERDENYIRNSRIALTRILQLTPNELILSIIKS